MMRIWTKLLGACFLIGLAPPALSQDVLSPKKHFKVEDVADLSKSDAEAIYQSLLLELAAGYAQSGDPSAVDFTKWRRDNTAPYLSAGHGNRFLNNYSNTIASGYLTLKSGEKMPEGSVLMKDSFTATAAGESFGGALFIMEKLSVKANPETGDWRYAMIMPDGSVLGDTTGENPEGMKFCHDCHRAVKNKDYLFLIPNDYRAN